jgi:hypothetical protein
VVLHGAIQICKFEIDGDFVGVGGYQRSLEALDSFSESKVVKVSVRNTVNIGHLLSHFFVTHALRLP